jgi:hypothetical protein
MEAFSAASLLPMLAFLLCWFKCRLTVNKKAARLLIIPLAQSRRYQNNKAGCSRAFGRQEISR